MKDLNPNSLSYSSPLFFRGCCSWSTYRPPSYWSH